MQVIEYLKDKTCTGLIKEPQHFQDGNYITYFFREDIAYEDQLDECLILYRSMNTNEVVGCKIYLQLAIVQ